MNGKLHDVYHLISLETGKPIPGTGTPWPTIAEYEAHALNTNSGEEAFGVAVWKPPGPTYQAPVGTEEQRASGKIWPGRWIDVTGQVWYSPREGVRWYHTGADLNLNSPTFDSDAHAPIYSIADGDVYAVREYSGWGNVICIRHEECLSRYAHVENIQVREGAAVKQGDHIANIGNAGGYWPYHLHFDIAKLDSRMADYPGDWPGADNTRVLIEYHNPELFLRQKIEETK